MKADRLACILEKCTNTYRYHVAYLARLPGLSFKGTAFVPHILAMKTWCRQGTCKMLAKRNAMGVLIIMLLATLLLLSSEALLHSRQTQASEHKSQVLQAHRESRGTCSLFYLLQIASPILLHLMKTSLYFLET